MLVGNKRPPKAIPLALTALTPEIALTLSRGIANLFTDFLLLISLITICVSIPPIEERTDVISVTLFRT